MVKFNAYFNNIDRNFVKAPIWIRVNLFNIRASNITDAYLERNSIIL